jgi:hypothetical protein
MTAGGARAVLSATETLALTYAGRSGTHRKLSASLSAKLVLHPCLRHRDLAPVRRSMVGTCSCSWHHDH